MAEYTTQDFTYTRSFINSVLGAFTSVPSDPLADAATVGLFTDPLAIPSPESVLTDFSASQPTWTGYAAASVTLTDPLRVTPDIQGLLGACTFVCTMDDDPNASTAAGYYVYSGSNLIGAETFPDDAKPSFADDGDFLALDAILPLPEYQSTEG